MFQKSDFICMDQYGYPTDSSHLDDSDDDGDDDQQIQDQKSETIQTTLHTDDTSAESPSTPTHPPSESPQQPDGTPTQEDENKNSGDTAATTREETHETSAAPSEQGGSPSSSWLGSSVTGWLGLEKEEQPDSLAEGEKKDEREKTQAEASLTSSVTGWLGFGGQRKSDNGVNNREGDKETASSFTSTMTGWLGFGGKKKTDSAKQEQHEEREIDDESEPKETFRSRKMSLDLEGSQLQEEEKEMGTLDWLGNGLSSTLGFGVTNQESKPIEEEKEKPAPSSWLDIGVGDILGFGKSKSEVDESTRSGFKETEKDTNLEQATASDYADISQPKTVKEEEKTTEPDIQRLEEKAGMETIPEMGDNTISSSSSKDTNKSNVEEHDQFSQPDIESATLTPEDDFNNNNMDASDGSKGNILTVDAAARVDQKDTSPQTTSDENSQALGGTSSMIDEERSAESEGEGHQMHKSIENEGKNINREEIKTVSDNDRDFLIQSDIDLESDLYSIDSKGQSIEDIKGGNKGQQESRTAEHLEDKGAKITNQVDNKEESTVLSLEIGANNDDHEHERNTAERDVLHREIYTTPTDESAEQSQEEESRGKSQSSLISGTAKEQNEPTHSEYDTVTTHSVKTDNLDTVAMIDDSNIEREPHHVEIVQNGEAQSVESSSQEFESSHTTNTSTLSLHENASEDQTLTEDVIMDSIDHDSGSLENEEVEALKEKEKQEELKEVEEIKEGERQQTVEEEKQKVDEIKEEQIQEKVYEFEKKEKQKDVKKLKEEEKHDELEEVKEEQKQEIKELKKEGKQEEVDDLKEEKRQEEIGEVREKEKQDVEELIEEEKGGEEEIPEVKEAKEEEKQEGLDEVEKEEKKEGVMESKEEEKHDEVEELVEEKKVDDLGEVKEEEKQEKTKDLQAEERQEKVEEFEEEKKQEEVEKEQNITGLKEEEKQAEMEEVKEEKKQEEVQKSKEEEKLKEVNGLKEKEKEKGEEIQEQVPHLEVEKKNTHDIGEPEPESSEKETHNENAKTEEEKREEEKTKHENVEESKEEKREVDEMQQVADVEGERRDKEEEESLKCSNKPCHQATEDEPVGDRNENISEEAPSSADELTIQRRKQNNQILAEWTEESEPIPSEGPERDGLGEEEKEKTSNDSEADEGEKNNITLNATGNKDIYRNNVNISDSNGLKVEQIRATSHIDNDQQLVGESGQSGRPNKMLLGQMAETKEHDHLAKNADLSDHSMHSQGHKLEDSKTSINSVSSDQIHSEPEIESQEQTVPHVSQDPVGSSVPSGDHKKLMVENESGGAFGLLKNTFSFFSQTSVTKTKEPTESTSGLDTNTAETSQPPAPRALEQEPDSTTNSSQVPVRELHKDSPVSIPTQQHRQPPPPSAEVQSHPYTLSPSAETPVQTKTLSKHYKNLLSHVSVDELTVLMDLFGRNKLQFLEYILGSSETVTDDPDNDESILSDIKRLLHHHRETLVAPSVRLSHAPQEDKEKTKMLIALQKLKIILEKLRETFNTRKPDVNKANLQGIFVYTASTIIANAIGILICFNFSV